MTFEELAFEVLKAEAQMTQEQRLQFWDVILMPYCQYCGREIDTTCHCQNDD